MASRIDIERHVHLDLPGPRFCVQNELRVGIGAPEEPVPARRLGPRRELCRGTSQHHAGRLLRRAVVLSREARASRLSAASCAASARAASARAASARAASARAASARAASARAASVRAASARAASARAASARAASARAASARAASARAASVRAASARAASARAASVRAASARAASAACGFGACGLSACGFGACGFGACTLQPCAASARAASARAASVRAASAACGLSACASTRAASARAASARAASARAASARAASARAASARAASARAASVARGLSADGVLPRHLQLLRLALRLLSGDIGLGRLDRYLRFLLIDSRLRFRGGFTSGRRGFRARRGCRRDSHRRRLRSRVGHNRMWSRRSALRRSAPARTAMAPAAHRPPPRSVTHSQGHYLPSPARESPSERPLRAPLVVVFGTGLGFGLLLAVGFARGVRTPLDGIGPAARPRTGAGDTAGMAGGADATGCPIDASIGPLTNVLAGSVDVGCAGTSTAPRAAASIRRSCQGRPKPGSQNPRPPKVSVNSSAWISSESSSAYVNSARCTLIRSPAARRHDA